MSNTKRSSSKDDVTEVINGKTSDQTGPSDVRTAILNYSAAYPAYIYDAFKALELLKIDFCSNRSYSLQVFKF
jgi:hypothetical protein